MSTQPSAELPPILARVFKDSIKFSPREDSSAPFRSGTPRLEINGAARSPHTPPVIAIGSNFGSITFRELTEKKLRRPDSFKLVGLPETTQAKLRTSPLKPPGDLGITGTPIPLIAMHTHEKLPSKEPNLGKGAGVLCYKLILFTNNKSPVDCTAPPSQQAGDRIIEKSVTFR